MTTAMGLLRRHGQLLGIAAFALVLLVWAPNSLNAFRLGKQSQEEVLRPDVVVLEEASLLLCEHDDSACAICEPFEHAVQSCSASRSTPGISAESWVPGATDT